MSKTDYQDLCNIDTSISERKRLFIGDIYSNQIECLKCGDKPRSKNKHDMAFCKCGNCAVDGGSHYVRVLGKRDSFKSITVLFNDLNITY